MQQIMGKIKGLFGFNKDDLMPDETQIEVVTRLHIVDEIYKAVDRLGSQARLCDEVGISPTALSLFLSGDRNPPMALLAYLGYGQKTVYYKLGDK